MSIRAVTDLAALRDRVGPDDPTAGFTDTLTKAVPTESLAAYTAFVAVVQALAAPDDQLLSWRWGAFVGFLALTLLILLPTYYTKTRANRPANLGRDQAWGRWLPFELVPVLLASVSWGLALPGGPLSVQIGGTDGVLTLAAVIIGGGALVSVTGLPLHSGTPATPPQPPQSPPQTPPQGHPGPPPPDGRGQDPHRRPPPPDASRTRNQPPPQRGPSTIEQPLPRSDRTSRIDLTGRGDR